MSSRRRPPRNRQVATTTAPTTSELERPIESSDLWDGLILLVQLSIIILCASFATLASQLALHPLYGSTSTSLYFRHLIGITCILSIQRPTMPAHQLFLIIGILLAAAPLSAKYLGTWTGRWGSSTWGPIVTQLALAVPVVGLTSVLIRRRLSSVLPDLSPIIVGSISAVMLFTGITIIEPLLWKIPSGGLFTSCNIFLALANVCSILIIVTAPFHPEGHRIWVVVPYTPTMIFAVPYAIAIMVKFSSPCSSPTLPATYTCLWNPPSNASFFTRVGAALDFTELPPTETKNITVNLLARTDSVTGTIVVGDYIEYNSQIALRFMRADHSLLGGRWLGKKQYGAPGGESIYGTFVQQEAIRFVPRKNTLFGRPETEPVLVIGLGVGIAADALISHGHPVHIVEIDPAVYTYARGYFHLQEPFSVDFKDARRWVNDHRKRLGTGKPEDQIASKATRFPMVIHDCFSGGGVPSHIFTMEFWEELKAIMTEDGVVAVNFVGHIESDSARAIWFTLQEAFGKKYGGRGCRVYHDILPTQDGAHTVNSTELLNMVYFCQKGLSDVGVEFRATEQSDLLESYMRTKVFTSMRVRELTKEEMTGFPGDYVEDGKYILTDKHNKLAEWQHELAVEHWSLMRDVMPDPVWEVY